MRIFKDAFLGQSRNAKACIIINEEDITFNYQSDRDTLRAFASKPLHILNNSLGYQITYYLDKFEYDKVHKTSSFSGNIIFNLDMAVNGHMRKEYEAILWYGYMSHARIADWLPYKYSPDFYDYTCVQRGIF